MRATHFINMVIVAVAMGLLEAAWTTPSAPGATYAGLGCFAIAVILGIVCWPRLWWVPGLSMLEEATQVFAGSNYVWRPNLDWVVHHWSAGYFGINLFPVVTFTLASVIGEAVWQWYKRRSARKSE